MTHFDYLQEIKEKAKCKLIPNVISLNFDEMGSHFEDDTLDLRYCFIT